MKKIILTLILFFICSIAHAATTYYAVATGNWSGTTTWSLSSGGATQSSSPVAGDTAIFDSNTGAHTVTISAAAACAVLTMTGSTGTLNFGTQTLTTTGLVTLAGAMTSTSGTLIVEGGATLSGTPTGTFPLLKFTTASQTLTSGGFTWGGALTFDFAGNFTLVGNWITSGLTTMLLQGNINLTSTETYTTNGGLTMTSPSGTAPTATIILGGGTWSGAATAPLYNNLTFAGNVTVSGNVHYRAGTITYSSGTITTTGSILVMDASGTLNTNGMSWNSIYDVLTFVLSSNFTGTGTLYTTAAVASYTGAFNLTIGTLYFQAAPNLASSSFSVPAGQTLTVTAGMNLIGSVFESTSNLATPDTFTLKSGTASSPMYLNYTGPANTCFINNMIFTDVNASGSNRQLYNFGGGTLTRSTNIYPGDPSMIGGPAIL